MAADKAPQSLQDHAIPGLPSTMYYIPNFITEDEESYILNKASIGGHNTEVVSLANNPIQIPANRWTQLTHRRLQSIPSQLTPNNTLIASPLPPWLAKPAVERILSLGIFSDAPHGINHCLINEYLPGQGIMPHEDGNAYHPVVATVSLGGTLVLDVMEKAAGDGSDAPRRWRVLQEPRSLLVTTGEAYTETLHGIAEVTEDRDLGAETVANWGLLGDVRRIEANGGVNQRTTRVSLTLRDVKKVSNVGAKIFGRPR